MASGSKAWTVIALATTMGAAIATRKGLNTTWKLATGRMPPSNPEHPDTSMTEALLWAAFSGLAVGAAKIIASRKAADYYRRSTGHLPAGLEDVRL
ncbi:MAG: DUF4235 domain-containing protein [Nocardioidaceae bacterium]